MEPIVEFDFLEMSLSDRFEMVINFAEQNDEYYAKIFGEKVAKKITYEYSISSLIMDSGLINIWDDLDLSTRAKYLTVQKIKNMTEVIRSHEKLQKDQKKVK